LQDDQNSIQASRQRSLQLQTGFATKKKASNEASNKKTDKHQIHTLANVFKKKLWPQAAKGKW